MSYSIEYEPEAIASLEKLSTANQKRIIAKINWLAENFEQVTLQSLTADYAGFYKLRVGDYRVIYEFSGEEQVIFMIRSGIVAKYMMGKSKTTSLAIVRGNLEQLRQAMERSPFPLSCSN